ncbi:MAG: hypothetical protein DMG12_28025 [Acidobacteria bacterium]|nr:MAG: hypothetical protein DMG12_28025 [Acidobacteriota bacterium]
MEASSVTRRIADKIVVITGASSGIGRATALALARERAKLVLVARRQNLLVQLEEEIRAAGGTACSMSLDLRQRANVETMIRSTHERFGRIDVLINNAGFGFWGTVAHTPAAVVREIFDLNFEAPLFASQLVIPIMRAQGSGHIINISSIVGKRCLPMSGIYCATKFERYGQVKRKFKPTGHIQSAGEVAEAIVRCIQKPKIEVYPNRSSRFLVWANAIAPGLVDKIVIRYLRDRLNAAKEK